MKKKLLTLLIGATFVFGLAACGSASDTSKNQNQGTNPGGTTTGGTTANPGGTTANPGGTTGKNPGGTGGTTPGKTTGTNPGGTNQGTGGTNTAGPTNSVQDGQAASQIYAQHCASCHGDQLEGVVGPNLQKIGSHLTKRQILEIIQNGKAGGMPAGLLSGADADKVALWLSKKK